MSSPLKCLQKEEELFRLKMDSCNRSGNEGPEDEFFQVKAKNFTT